jgi:hypothetical protein
MTEDKDSPIDKGIRPTSEEKEELRRLHEEKSKRKQAEQSAEAIEGEKKPKPGPPENVRPSEPPGGEEG